MTRRRSALAALVAACVALGGCGGTDPYDLTCADIENLAELERTREAARAMAEDVELPAADPRALEDGLNAACAMQGAEATPAEQVVEEYRASLSD